jgi:hypothetical protein
VSARPRAGAEWGERYEALRAHALGQASLDIVPLGLALLRHRGVAAWMTAQTSAGESRAREDSRFSRWPTRHEFMAPRSELVQLLAGTALLATAGRAR